MEGRGAIPLPASPPSSSGLLRAERNAPWAASALPAIREPAMLASPSAVSVICMPLVAAVVRGEPPAQDGGNDDGNRQIETEGDENERDQSAEENRK